MPDFLQEVRASTAELLRELDTAGWSDADVAAPSLCRGWTRGHVLTHIARNADGISDTLAGALRGEIVARYPDGWDARNAAIDAGAGRPFAVLADDVRSSADRLDRMFDAIAEADGWQLSTEHGDPANAWPFRRWREVEVHRVDLAAGYTPDRWPPLLVRSLLPDAAGALGDRVSGAVRVRVAAEGCVVPELAGMHWAAGVGEPVEVAGPDWAILAWLAGRPSVAAGALTATPELTEWR